MKTSKGLALAEPQASLEMKLREIKELFYGEPPEQGRIWNLPQASTQNKQYLRELGEWGMRRSCWRPQETQPLYAGTWERNGFGRWGWRARRGKAEVSGLLLSEPATLPPGAGIVLCVTHLLPFAPGNK